MHVHVRTINEHKWDGLRRHVGDIYAVSPEAVGVLEERNLAASDDTFSALWSAQDGAILSPNNIATRYRPRWPKDGPRLLRVLQLCQYDPGSAAYRYHSALNASGVAQSAFVRWGHSNPHCDLRQYDGTDDRASVERLFLSADVIMTHIDYRPLLHELRMSLMPHHRVVRMYHGSIEPRVRNVLVENEKDKSYAATQIGARLYHQRFSDRMHWLPIPMPVKDYKLKSSLARSDGAPMRIAHSPTRRAIKGTDVLCEVVESMRADGEAVELVMIEGMAHGDALKLKQTCHVTFDSFWLGIQGSGLEAGAMQQMVIAGDEAVRGEYVKEFGAAPYTFANDATSLRVMLQRAYDDEAWRTKEVLRVAQYVRDVHSYEAVGETFAKIMTTEHINGPADRC
jgi:hypothetical protein